MKSQRSPEEWLKIAERWTMVAIFSAGVVTGLTIAKILLYVCILNGWPIK